MSDNFENLVLAQWILQELIFLHTKIHIFNAQTNVIAGLLKFSFCVLIHKQLLKFEFLQCMWQGNVQETNVWRSNCGSCRHCFLEFGSNLCKNSNSCSQTNARTRVLATMQKKTNEFLLSYILGAISTSTSRSVTFTARTSVQAA